MEISRIRNISSAYHWNKVRESDVDDLKEWLGRDEIYTYWGRKASRNEKNPELIKGKISVY